MASVTRMGFENNTVDIELNPLESCFLVIEPDDHPDNKMINQPEPAEGITLKLETEWNAEFYPVEGNPFSRKFKELTDFKSSEDQVLRNFAGTVIYKTDFELSDLNIDRLSLGEVNEGVTQVIINGKNLGSTWYGLHDFDIDSCLSIGTNKIEIIYTSLLFNYCRSLEIIEAKRWIRNRDLISNGLMGPVVLKGRVP
jgi:hypothetical protein